MECVAAQYIVISDNNFLKGGVIEINSDKIIKEISILTKERAATLFYNGIIFSVKTNVIPKIQDFLELQSDNPKKNIFDMISILGCETIKVGEKINNLFLLENIDFSTIRIKKDTLLSAIFF